MSNAAVAAISVALYILLAPGVGGLLQGVDRKATARMQGRQGPPLLQSFYDVGKLLGKETKYMNHIQIVCHVSFLIFVIFTGALFFGGGDLKRPAADCVPARCVLRVSVHSHHQAAQAPL